MRSEWLNLGVLEIIAISSFWIALLILAVQLRQAYLLQECQLDDRQKGRLRPESDLSRRIRTWGAVSFLGLIFALTSLLKNIFKPELQIIFLNLSVFFLSLAILLIFIAYLRYLCATYLIDFYATMIIVEPISLTKK